MIRLMIIIFESPKPKEPQFTLVPSRANDIRIQVVDQNDFELYRDSSKRIDVRTTTKTNQITLSVVSVFNDSKQNTLIGNIINYFHRVARRLCTQ